MEKPVISIVVAMGTYDRAIGKEGELLWHIPDDLKYRFKALTLGHPVIMGRKTFESIVNILGKPLPDRTNIIVTRDKNYTRDDCIVSHSIEEALQKAREMDKEEVFIIGGGEIYIQSLPYVDRLYLTLVDDKQDADAFFPDYGEFTKKTFEETHVHEGLAYTWVNLERE